jgi:hypothetical protein
MPNAIELLKDGHEHVKGVVNLTITSTRQGCRVGRWVPFRGLFYDPKWDVYASSVPVYALEVGEVLPLTR